MHIGIEAERANHPAKTGVEHYAKELIAHLAKIDRENQYTLYLRTPPEAWFSQLPQNFRVKVMPFPKFWTQLRLSWEMLWHPPDVLFVPASALPLIHPRRSVVTLHDTNFMYYPETDTRFMRSYLLWSYRYIVRTAAKIIAISESTKNDLIKFFHVRPEKVAVVYHGYQKTTLDFNKLSEEVAAQLPEKYILFLSTIQPRKNLPLLIEAFRELKQENPDLPHKLVVAGKPGWKFEPILRKIEENKDIVVYLNHIADNDRWPVYHKADLFIMPTLYEGFGMWILEAFECDVPVAVSNVSSLPEVGGEAALYFDPNNKAEIKKAMQDVLMDKSLRDRLVAAGRNRLTLFSWDKCAKETLAVFKST
jgi:glycosyltransferase involved in cell wall biosynthesis